LTDTGMRFVGKLSRSGLHRPSQCRPTPKDAPQDPFELSDRLLLPNGT